VTYRIDVTNTGPVVATDVLITDPLPVGLTFVSSNPAGCASANSTVTCAIGDVAPGETVTVNIVTRAADPLPPAALDATGSVPNTAGVSADGTNCPIPMTGPVPAAAVVPQAAVTPQAGEQCTSTVTVPVRPVIDVDKTTPATQITPGAPLPYVITVSNEGMVVAQDVVAVDTLPEGLTFMRSQAPVCANGGGQDVVCQVGDLAVGQEMSITIMTMAANPFPTNGGVVVNTVTIEGQLSNCVDGSTDPRCRAAAMLPDPAPASGALPRTGSDLARTVAAGLLAVAVGVALVATTRPARRRRRAGPA
jgi:uncharacterized repeat protein (TIGR01451 family)